MKVAIDVGHARGTGSRGNGLEEHAVCAVIAEELSRLLREAGHAAVVYDYPEMSNRGDLNASIAAINAWGADLAVSLHCDCSENVNARGGHVCYVSGTGYRVARAVAGRLCALLPGRAEGVVLRRDLAFLNRTRCAAILCECGFISNAGDAEVQSMRPGAIAGAIAEGICAYMERG